MANKKKEILIGWLNNAYSMEQSIVKTLERQAGQLESMPEIKAKVEEHITQTKSQAERVKGCIERLGGSVSQPQSAFANLMGTIDGLSTEIADDKIVKDIIIEHSTENLEIASYLALLTAAREVGDTETETVVKQILEEEEAMAAWTIKHIPEVVKHYLASK